MYEYAEPVTMEYDAGLRQYLTSIYNWMMAGLAISAVTSYLSITTGLITTLAHGGFLFWVVTLAPFGIILYMAFQKAGRGSIANMAIAYIVFTVLLGLSLSVTLAHYTTGSVVLAFVSTSAAFAGLSLWAYTTKRNLTGMGNFFLMALIGLIVALILAAILQSTFMTTVVSIIGVIIFAGLVAYDTQTMRANYAPGEDDRNARMAIWSALDLYLDFVNLFLFILRLVGVSSNND